MSPQAHMRFMNLLAVLVAIGSVGQKKTKPCEDIWELAMWERR